MHKTVGTFRILSAEDSNGIIHKRILCIICKMTSLDLFLVIEWIAAKKFVLDLDKTNTIEFITKRRSRSCLFRVIMQRVLVITY